ncbi:hypothetical protein EP118_02395 [Halobacteriovorax sp. Y22]|nr:hypothetical protein EP118_02395 [Halobacteriovorax sp. Y22]
MTKLSLKTGIFTILLTYLYLSMAQVYAQDSMEMDLVINDITIENDLGEDIGNNLLFGIEELESKTGETLDIIKVTNDLENLKKKNDETYENVELEVLPIDSSSISIKFEMQKKRIIKRILISIESIEKDKNDIDNDLRKELKLRRGGIFKSKDMMLDISSIENFYKKKGYPLVKVKKKLELNSESEIIIDFKVLLNTAEVKIDDIKITGNNYFTDKELNKIIKSKESSFFSKNLFIEEEYLNDIEIIKRHYMESGFINIEVEADYKVKKDEADIYFKISENKQLKLNKLSIEGNSFLETQEILNILNTKLPTAFSIKKQREAIQRVRELYGNNGYIFTQITMNYDDKSESATLVINEGKPQKIIKIEIIGNTKTVPEVIYEKLNFNIGEMANTSKINESILNLYKTGFFKDVKIDFFPMTTSAGKVVIQLQENSTQTIQFSLGSAYGGAGFGVSLSDNNLFGTGTPLALSTMISKEINRVGLVYNNENIFGSEIDLNISANHDFERSYHYKEKKTALRIMFEKQINKNISLGLGTRLEFVSIDSLSQQYSDNIDLSDTKDVVSGLIGSFAYRIQDKEEKTNGVISVHLLPSFHNQELFFKGVVNAQVTRDIYENDEGGKHQISGRVTLGYASQSTPFYERLQGGGNGTIRGFEYGSINKDGQLGSNSMISANLTYSLPIYKDIFSGVLFLDAFAPGSSDFAFDDFRVVGGLGLRAHMNAGFVQETFEAGVTIPLISRQNDITKPFYFIIGDYDPAYNL